ncbi:glycosyltransferase family A protein [Hymenobacter sp. BRD67]|uniref:glycosyltransferase family A protein n=1 Tax=Hymenobacter sp. BRD67 TaxID=2675877 RepID=UPI001566E629|nr:glycosyltransferase family A protein [Hymenobacter sp. BRD67]QKG52112.1 glycosyltransferase family 2 protein [Hymenobacter sp. BRD67]
MALCHNHAPYLREALDSVLAQDYAALEVWLVDNGSTDGSPAILQEYAQHNPAWHLLLLPENLGNCRAFNQAFLQSQGEFVVDFATDDVLLPQRLSQQVALFRQLPPIMAWCIPTVSLSAKPARCWGCTTGRPEPGACSRSRRAAGFLRTC